MIPSQLRHDNLHMCNYSVLFLQSHSVQYSSLILMASILQKGKRILKFIICSVFKNYEMNLTHLS